MSMEVQHSLSPEQSLSSGLTDSSEQTDSSAVVRDANPTKDGQAKKDKYPGFNLYIKYLDDSFTDSTLREAFEPFGTITSAKVMCDTAGKSRGFGFVCFATQEEADKALLKMNGRIVGSKPLYVAMAQSKEERKQYLSDRYKTQNQRFPGPPVTLHPAVQVRESAPLSYIPVTSAISRMPTSYVSTNDTLNSNLAGVPYVMPTNPAVTYMPMSYQPLLFFPNLTVVPQHPPPPAQIPVLHQPIYLHSSKTNTLIYSTGVPTNPPQMPVPGIQVYSSTSGNIESTLGEAVHTIPAGRVATRQNETSNDQDNTIDTTLAHEVQTKVIVCSDNPGEEIDHRVSPNDLSAT